MGLHSNPITEDSMTPIHDHNDVQPFRTDTEYLEAEFAWVTARCLHLGARLDAERDARDAEPALAFADEPEAAWPEETRARASARMKSASEHLLLVVKNPNANKDKPGARVIGQITACDIMGDEPLRISRDTGMRHDEIPVRMVMTPNKEIRVLDWEIASRVKVGNILATMKEQDCCHLLVVEEGELRGIFSRSEINKHLQHADMEQLGCAHSLADLIHRVA